MASDFLRKYTGPSIALGRAIAAAREAKGLSQSHLARLAGCTYSQIFRLERGESGTRRERLAVICEILGLDIATLLGLTITEQELPEAERVMKPKKRRRPDDPEHTDLMWLLFQLSMDCRELNQGELEVVRPMIEAAKTQIDYFRKQKGSINGS